MKKQTRSISFVFDKNLLNGVMKITERKKNKYSLTLTLEQTSVLT
nr:MAG TPA: hypothetical protein [Caudoviricetes sp.]